jgi:2-C-methyl-D-erythritol 4-phosphate cytidylyltransferase
MAAMKVALIVPAAGSGERLGHGIPKALVPVAGLPLLRLTLERLSKAATFVETIVLAPEESFDEFAAAVRDLPPTLGRIAVVRGGATRQMSVAAGAAALGAEADVVCVHDAARPLVARRTVLSVLDAAFRNGAATAASRPSDSIREESADGVTAPRDRSRLWMVETPQAFRRMPFVNAHDVAVKEGKSYTDDASLVEAIGQAITVVESMGRNLKITVESDLVLTEDLLRREKNSG